jgi:nucleoside-diphosphate-sugar epimerase
MKRRISNALVKENDSLKRVMKQLDKTGYGIAIVVDAKQRLRGVVTDGDIRRSILRGATIKTKVRNVMNRKPVFIREDEKGDLDTLFKTENVIGRIPVVDKNGNVVDLAIENLLPDGSTRITTLNQTPPNTKEGKILVIGGAGYIGSVLVRRLLRRGYKVRVLDLLLYGRQSIKEVKDDNFEFIRGDTRDIHTLINAMKDCSAVIHLAELVGDPLCAQNTQRTKEINLFATNLIGTIAKYHMMNRFIYISSCSVYGANKDDKLLDERSRPNPLSVYAQTKLESEKALLMLRDDAFSPCILRLGTVYGPSPRMRFDLVINILTARALSEGKITINGGQQYRPNVHVNDVCKAIILALEAPINKVKGEVFNVGCESQNHQVKTLGKFVKNIIPSAELEFIVGGDERDYKVCFEKIRDVLSFRPIKNVKQGIKEIKAEFELGKIKNYKDKKYRNT